MLVSFSVFTILGLEVNFSEIAKLVITYISFYFPKYFCYYFSVVLKTFLTPIELRIYLI